jgi:para-nitrobenzyl esterase
MSSAKFMLQAIACAAACVALAAHSAPIKVEGGALEGKQEGDLTVYRGIPFAAPPVGDLRWKGPQPAAKWSGTLPADKFADACMQGSGGRPAGSSAAPAPEAQPREGVSEDCLYLNVWTPAKSARERLPVMVWIYGGGFGGGATSTPLYSGEQLASKGVVLVSVAYRVGVFGFMAHPELSAEAPHGVFRRSSGNYGLLDQIAGLQWIQRNIAAFGGDPKRVTIFGESAGAIAVSMLAASPLAKDLFRGAISESGGSFGPTRVPSEPGENIPSLNDAEKGGVQLGQKLQATTLAALRAVDAQTVQANSRGIAGIAWPVLDGWVIPGDQYELYLARKYNKTPILVGINSDEGASFVRETTAEKYVADVQQRFGPHAQKLLAVYKSESPEGVTQAARDLMRDASFGWHTWTWARLQSRTKGGNAYVYYFDQRPPYPPNSRNSNVRGAPHASELPYVFQHLDQQQLAWTQADRDISAAIGAYWTNFVKTGDPNGTGLPHWPAFTEANQQRMIFKGTPHAVAYDNRAQLEAFEEYFAWRRSAEGKKFVEKASSDRVSSAQ